MTALSNIAFGRAIAQLGNVMIGPGLLGPLGHRFRSDSRLLVQHRVSWQNGDRRQILIPALRLLEAVQIGSESARIEVMNDPYHDSFLVHLLVQAREQNIAFLRVELPENR